MWSHGSHMLLCIWDPYHRCWNDIKNAAKKTTAKIWRCILELCIIHNLSFGPFGTGQFHFKKHAALNEFLQTESFQGEVWAKYQPMICQERRCWEPSDPDDCNRLFESMENIENFHTKGCLVKLMRWFSVFEAASAWGGDYYATRMILENSCKHEQNQQEVDAAPLEDDTKDDKAQLGALKKRKGTWSLAPTLITEALVSKKDVLLSVGRAAWKLHAHRARCNKSPASVCQDFVEAAGQRKWTTELVETVSNSLWRLETIQHILPRFRLHENVLEWHMDFLRCLLQHRSMSLTCFHLLPPFRYAHLLSGQYPAAKAAHDLARREFAALLAAESAAAAGESVLPLQSMYWTLNPLIRAVYLAHEQDAERGGVIT